MNNPKVLVGCPTSDYKDYCLKQYTKSIKSLTYSNYDILLVDNSKDNNYYNKIKQLNIPVIKDKFTEKARDRIVFSRNIIREYVLKNNYDYFLSLEQDVISPKSVIERLLKHKKQVVSGVVFHLVPTKVNQEQALVQTPLVARENKDNKDKLDYFGVDYVMNNPQLLEIDYCGMGCVLIHRNILKKIKFRYGHDEKGAITFDDIHFCRDAKKLGYNIYADFGVKCKHLLFKRKYHWEDIE